jgi:hypothetical protein
MLKCVVHCDGCDRIQKTAHFVIVVTAWTQNEW